MSHCVGIDLGTTNSAIAHVDEHGQPVVILNRFGEPITPSVLCFRNGEVIVGSEAKELQAAGEPQIAAFFKRHMGDPNFVFHAAGRDHSAAELAAYVVRALRRDAEAELGEKINRAVITVPAYFRNREREATIEAGRSAGLEVLQVINEPTAAAMAYGFQGADREQTLLVYDLGGGTFDVTLLKLGPEGLRVLTSEGDHELGGKDWDERIVEFLADRFESEFGSDPFESQESLADLLVRAEDAKKKLSVAQTTTLSIVHEGDRGRYTLERALFEEITADLMERTMELSRRAIEELGLKPREIDGVLLVGGSTRMPMVTDFVCESFGQEPLHGVHVDEAVALGAALRAYEKAGEGKILGFLRGAGASSTVDVTNHSLGMIALNEDASAYLNSIVLPKNTPVPCRQMRPYKYRKPSSEDGDLEVFMTQGESESPADVDYLGLYRLGGIPAGEEVVLDIEYGYDDSGTVQVSGQVRGHSGSLDVHVEPLPDDVPDRFLRAPEKVTVPEHVSAYLAFDLSGSMNGRPLEEAQKAARSFLANVDLAHCSLGLIAFADQVSVKLEASQNARKIEKAIHDLEIGEVGIGNQADPFEKVLQLMSGVEGRRFVITLADGVWVHQSRAIDRARTCKGAGIESIAIGFGQADEEFLKKIASSDEASFFTNLEGLVGTFSHVAQVITESGGGEGSFLQWLGGGRS